MTRIVRGTLKLLVVGVFMIGNYVLSQNPQAVFSPNSSNSGTAYCVNIDTGQVVPNCNMSLSTYYYYATNGHYHDDPSHPISSVTPSSGNTGSSGYMPIRIQTTRVGQIESLYLQDDDSGYGILFDYAVGYGNFVYVDNSAIWTQIGGNTTNHGNNTWNHWMTPNAQSGLSGAVTSYLNTYNPGQKVCINDMSLPIGGVFDINNTWNPPHSSHDYGTAADIASTTNQCSASYIVPPANQQAFIQLCVANGALAANSIVEGNHVHCRWPN